MTEPGDFLREIVSKLEEAGIPYMATGSLGSGFHGKPRATKDFDLLISPRADQIAAFVGSLREGIYADLDSALDALRRRSMFNIIETESSWKIDLIILKDTPFCREEFSRRKTEEVHGIRLSIASPEDIILSKLEWARKTESERQLTDATGVAEVKWSELDFSYLRHWAQELDVEDLLARVLAEAERLREPDPS